MQLDRTDQLYLTSWVRVSEAVLMPAQQNTPEPVYGCVLWLGIEQREGRATAQHIPFSIP